MNEMIRKLTLGKSPVMIVLMGIPASGKSTFCRKYLTDFTRINLDTIGSRTKENEEFERAVKAGDNTVIDNTNVTTEERARYISHIPTDYAVFGIFFKSVVRDCVARNEQREGKAHIPSKAIAAKSNQLQFPRMEEGFDRLYFAEQRDNDFVITDWKE